MLLPVDNATFKIAQQAISGISKGDITELKALNAPPQMIKEVMACVMIFLREDTDWLTAKRAMANAGQFLTRLSKFDINSVTKK